MVNPTPELSDLRKLVRAYGVLAGTCDNERAIVGRISRRWIAVEVERMLALADIPYRFFYSNRGREILASEFFSGQDLDPTEIDPDTLDIPVRGRKIYINSNRIPKLEPQIDAAVVAANLLLGVQLYGHRGKGFKSVDHDLIIAAMLQDTLGKKHRYSSFDPDKFIAITDRYILAEFGKRVCEKTRHLQTALSAFLDNIEPSGVEPEIANAIAAIMISRLRLTARAAGDAVLSFAGRVQRQELIDKGIDPDVESAERPFLEREY
ncbi:MAG: hypothetical protein KDK27_19320, partial [Leptospiraceae bacterium]|nr:hypothetical protein [Leptospiraceae bacterium]